MAKPKRLRSVAQNRRIHGLLNQIRKDTGLGKDELDDIKRSLCRQISGQDHSSQLSHSQAGRLIATLAERAGGANRPAPKKADKPQEAGLSRVTTPLQQAVLQQLFKQAGFREETAIRGWTRRQIKRPWPQNQRDVTALMEPLQEMVLRRVSPPDLHKRAQALRGNSGLDAWQVGFIEDLCTQFKDAHAVGNLDTVMTTHKLAKLMEAEQACGVDSGA